MCHNLWEVNWLRVLGLGDVAQVCLGWLWKECLLECLTFGLRTGQFSIFVYDNRDGS
jgi:hypothetical protein